MLVNCDECKQDFEVDAKVKKIKGDVEKTFLHVLIVKNNM